MPTAGRTYSGKRRALDAPHSLTTILLMALVAIFLASATAAYGSSGPPAKQKVFNQEGRINWKPCKGGFSCARVKVPLDWDRPGGRKIRLGVIRLRATRPNRRIGSLFVNPGGPGSSGIDSVRSLIDAREVFGRGRFDLVGWDLRGSAGASTAVKCFANQKSRARFWGKSTIPTTAAASRAYRRKTAAFARRCGQRSGRLMRHISSADQARDLDYLRRLAGDRKLNFYGFSYGTLLGQTYANMFPRRVRSMILDSVVDPVAVSRGNAAEAANAARDSDLVLRRFASLCEQAGPELCALAGDGPVLPRIETLLARELPTPAPGAEPRGPLTRGDVLMALRALAEPGAWPPLAEQLDEAVRGDGSSLATTARAGYRTFRAVPTGDGASAMLCADSPARQGSRAWPAVISRLARVSEIAGPFLGWLQWAPCASWPVKSASRYTGPWNRKTRNPILVMGNEFDPNVPFMNARRASRRLGNAVLLKQVGYGHGAMSNPSPCTMTGVGSYLVGPRTAGERRTCPSGSLPFAPQPSP
jgi:pimeloyl-ACP methyl ester carboxylesterase